MKIIFALLLTASVLCGGTLDFRSGKVLCAEISTQVPNRLKKLSNPVFELPEKPVYAALTVLFDEGRSISLHDYAIDIFGSSFRCIAIQRNNSFISVAESPQNNRNIWQTVEQITPKFRYTLFFALDPSAVIGSDSRETLELKALFHPGSPGDKIPFENLGQKAFTPQSQIPLSGKIAAATGSKGSAPQPPQPAAKKAAAKVESKTSKTESKAPAVKKTAAKVESKTSKTQSKAPAVKKTAAKKSSKTSKAQSKAAAAKKKKAKK